MPVATPTVDKSKYAQTFERGARRTTGANGAGGSTGASRPRLPQALAEELKELAWKRRTNLNALIVEVLEQYLDAQRA
jgi:hypothetical protein